MRRLLQPGSRNLPQPLWLRLLAVMGVALILVASTGQVCHTHAELWPQKDSHQNAPAPDHCPLCVAMHSALPATMQIAHGVVATEQRVAPPPVANWLGSVRLFDLQTRPPPAA